MLSTTIRPCKNRMVFLTWIYQHYNKFDIKLIAIYPHLKY